MSLIPSKFEQSGLLAKGIYQASIKDLRKSILCTVNTLAFIIILDIFGVNTTSIIAVLGTAGLAVGLALKDTLSNVASGVMLLILQPLKVNDFIECNGVTGTVEKIGPFTCDLQTADGLFISVPNGQLWNHSIKNFSRKATRRMDISVSIAYDDSIDEAFAILKKLVANEPRLLAQPEPQYLLATMAESSIDIKLRAWAKTSDFWPTYWDLQKSAKEAIEAAGLSIPFSQRDLHLFVQDPKNLKL